MKTIICVACGIEVVALKAGKQYCSEPCRLQHRSTTRAAEREVRRAERMAIRDCPECGQAYTPRGTRQKYCGSPCERAYHGRQQSKRTAERRAAELAARAPRFCQVCATPIDHLQKVAFRCHACAKAYRAKTRTPTEQAVKLTTPKASLTRRDAPKLSAPKVKPDMALPNLNGDWYPGWDGPWSPNLSPVARELIERAHGGAPERAQPPIQKDEAA